MDFHLAGRDEPADDLNGIVPGTFADQLIKFRIPYVMAAELVTLPGTTAIQFNEAAFAHNIDKPFEVHQMHVELTGQLADHTIPDTQPFTLDRRVRLRIEDTAKNEKITKRPTLVSTLVEADKRLWRWEVPYTFTVAEGFTISVDTDALPLICQPAAADCTSESVQIAEVRTEISFEGFLVILRPASDSR